MLYNVSLHEQLLQAVFLYRVYHSSKPLLHFPQFLLVIHLEYPFVKQLLALVLFIVAVQANEELLVFAFDFPARSVLDLNYVG